MADEKPLISIVMPVRNGELYLAECLNSILNQSYSNWELWVINDHSSDTTFEIVKKFEQASSRINVLNNNGKGIIDALRLAYSKTIGTYITRMDADDIMMPQKLESLVSILIQKGMGHVAVGCVQYFSETTLGQGYQRYATWLNELTIASENFSAIYKECSIPSPCWMVHRKDFETCGAFKPHTYPEDYDLAFRFRKQGLTVAGISTVLHRWRDYPIRASRTDPNYADNRFTAIKIKYFLEDDLIQDTELVVWGAGNKGKEIAKQFVALNVPFTWITNNPNKVGRDIYQVILKEESFLQTSQRCQVIIAISGPAEANHIQQIKEGCPQHLYYSFC